jgi:hypothetical protein
MNIVYCFASPTGDVPVDNETLSRPFIAEPLQYHPFMILGDFFDAVRDFVLGKDGQRLTTLLSQSWGLKNNLDDIDSIVIRYEKYGTLYQIASVNIISGDKNIKLAVSAALTPSARENIEKEYNLISTLNKDTGLSFLPRVFFMDMERIEKDGRIETMVLSLAEWFEGFHEWHFYRDMEGKDRIAIWDMGGGNRFISEHEAYGIIRESSKILTLYYDMATCRRIIPWHHGAGDFPACIDSGKVTVRLVTVRGYEPLSPGDERKPGHPLMSLLLFFLEVMIKMRMDKREGVGDTTWADKIFVKAAVDGFFDAMWIREEQGRNGSIRVNDFIAFAKTLTGEEIEKLIQSQLTEYRAYDTSDYHVINARLEEHANDIFNIVQHLPS